MAGAALSKMWATNPKLACCFRFELIEGGSLVCFARDAIKDGWAPSDY